MEGKYSKSSGGGHTVRGMDSPSNFYAAAGRNENPTNNVRSAKRNRGRPRKYESNGEVSSPLSPIPMPSPNRATAGSDGGGDYPVKRGRGRPPKNLGELVPCSVGTNFTPHAITVRAGEVDDTNAEQGREIHTNHMGVDAGCVGRADIEMPSPNHEHVAPDAVLIAELSNPLVEENRLQVSILVAEGVETGATAFVAHPNAGALFELPFKAPLIGHEMVGGFSVPFHHVPLYTQVWQKYGHIATTKKGTHCPTLAGIVASVLSMITEINDKTLATVTGDFLKDWEALMVMIEGLEFNVAWLRQRLDSIKAAQAVIPTLDMIRQEEEAVAAETERIRKLSLDLKVRYDALNKMKEVFSDCQKPLLHGAL